MIVLPAILRSCLGSPKPTLVPAPPARTTATTGKVLRCAAVIACPFWGLQLARGYFAHGRLRPETETQIALLSLVPDTFSVASGLLVQSTAEHVIHQTLC